MSIHFDSTDQIRPDEAKLGNMSVEKKRPDHYTMHAYSSQSFVGYPGQPSWVKYFEHSKHTK